MQKISDTLKNLNILYAEDNLQIQESTSKILELLFNKVYLANDGVEALKIFKEENIHILLLDYVMPNINGIEVTKEIKNTNKKIPIIITSGHCEKDKLISCIRLGITDYIEKPVKYEMLISAFNKAIIHLEENNMIRILLKENIYYDYLTKSIITNEKETKLTKQEIEFLEILLKNRSKLISKQDLLDRIFGNIDIELNTLRNILYRLRKKLRTDLIVTVKDLGYMIP